MSSPRTITNIVGAANDDQFINAPRTMSPTGDVSESSSPPPTSISSHTQTSNTTPPTTPPRGRSATRYPASLGPGRVPLHRRGTSKTYERLEDLLREAGYKETRVFTPEAERAESEQEERRLRARASGSVRGGVGAVVGFLAGLVSRNSSLAREAMSGDEGSRPSMSNDVPVWSPPPSPLAQLQRAKHLNASSSASLSGYSYSTSTESLHKSPRQSYTHLPTDGLVVHRPRVAHHHVVQLQHSSRGLPHHSPPHLRQYVRHQSSSNFVAPDVPGSARAYLRHMASAPNIQPLSKRPSSSDVSLRSHQAHKRGGKPSRRTIVLNADDIEESDDYRDSRGHGIAEPPLPRNWVESVARAILTGGTGAGTASDTASTKTLSTRQTTSALSDNTNVPRKSGGATTKARAPWLCAQVQEQRSRTSESKVSRTWVVCRSAPASRATSRTRPLVNDADSPKSRRTEGGRRKDKIVVARKRVKGKRRESDGVPSLARTKAENEDWSPRSRYLGGWGMSGDMGNDQHGGFSSDENDEDDDDDEEDEGELDLGRLLVPARRQHSIRSLRKHLQRPCGAAGSIRGVPPASPRASGRLSPWAEPVAVEPGRHRRNWRDDSWGTGRGRQWVAGEEDDEGDGYGYGVSGGFSGSEARAGPKRRRGLPGSWAQWAGVGGGQ
ncbi:hypothetical protein BV22DRAFT_1087463 [Leucogyrophana mollusca]|uniref:Uncharacterized protein n=1 Tax=Leucogyrophana mollusca TaxID=85980 RepID=A0ACB8BK58_9AGAM|nr:hypothetical protein BV22DRAFT_1087463 [Leucogyrophana mollusca]